MAANVALLTLSAKSQGTIAATENKRTDGDLKFSAGIEVHAYIVGVTVPTDPTRPTVITGRSVTSPFTVFAVTSSASPKVLQSAFTGEVFPTVKLAINRINATGKPQLYASYELTNAVISNLTHNAGVPTTSTAGPSGTTVVPDSSTADLERIDFTYETLTFTNHWGNTVSTISVTGTGK